MNETGKHELIALATANVRDILRGPIGYNAVAPKERALVIYDTHSGLGDIMTEAYRAALPDAQFVDFDSMTKEEIIALFDALSPNDLVVMIQSTGFRLNDFRIRIYLFKLGLKVIEHIRLARNSEQNWSVYVNALAYDADWYRGVGHRLRKKLKDTKEVRIITSNGTESAEFIVTGGLEDPKPNLGDYTGMQNIGGAFPIGEVFTEAQDLTRVHGSFFCYAFADENFELNTFAPFRVDVQDGMVTGWSAEAPELFANVIAKIKELERPLVRELGFGMNRAITKEHHMEDITAFERILGIHLSLGEKHSVYKKAGIQTHKTRFHVDVFPAVTSVVADGEVIFDGKTYTL